MVCAGTAGPRASRARQWSCPIPLTGDGAFFITLDGNNMTTSLEILDKSLHAGLRLQPAGDYTFATALTVAPLAGEEVGEAAVSYPLVFLPADQGTVLPHALLGLAGANTYLDAHQRWRVGAYIPAAVRCHPFAAVQVADAQGARRWPAGGSADETEPWMRQDCHDLKLSNRPVRTRMPGGVAGVPPIMGAPYAD